MKTLIVSSKSYEKARADGLCGKNLKEGFHSDDVFLLGYADIKGSGLLNRGNNEFEFFYHKKKNNDNRLLKIVKRLIEPEIDYELVKQFEKNIESIIVLEKIDVLVAVFFPLETVVAVSNIKNRHPDIKTIIYEVDSSTDIAYYLSRLDKYYIRAYKCFMKRIYRYYDYVLVMNSHYEHVKKIYGAVLKNKLKRIDSPVLCGEKIQLINKENKNTIDFFYTGTFVEDTYSPEPFIEFFKINEDKLNWRLHFYSKGCERILNNAMKNDSRIMVHGYVSTEELDKAIKNADVFLSIDSKFKPNSIPSKAFRFFDSNMPIIHFSHEKNIFVEEYMEKYPRGFVVYNYSIQEQNSLVLEFIDKVLKGQLPEIDAKSVFKMNTPEYSADLIKELMNK